MRMCGSVCPRVYVCACSCTRVYLGLHTAAGYLPNCVLAVEAMLATSLLGAVWSSASPDFGVSVGQAIFLSRWLL